jgi:hypothetical protein
MTVLRNVLILCGAGWLSSALVSVVRNGVFLAFYGARVPAQSAAFVYLQASGTVVVFGVLCGALAGRALAADRAGWWPLCLAAVAWLASPVWFWREGFSSALSLGYAESAASAASAVVTLISFAVVRSGPRKRAVSSAR